MDKHSTYIDALTYLASFPDGISHYNWDRALTYKLKYGIHPGVFIKSFIDNGFIENTHSGSGEVYKISAVGLVRTKQNLDSLSEYLEKIKAIVAVCNQFNWEIKKDIHVPLLQVDSLGKNMMIWIHRTDSEVLVCCEAPTDVGAMRNQLSFSYESAMRSEILEDLVIAHVKWSKNTLSS